MTCKTLFVLLPLPLLLSTARKRPELEAFRHQPRDHRAESRWLGYRPHQMNAEISVTQEGVRASFCELQDRFGWVAKPNPSFHRAQPAAEPVPAAPAVGL